MSILLALLITVAIIVIGFFVASLATITYSDPFFVPNRYDLYRSLKERSEYKGVPFDYVDFNDFLERHEGIKVGSEKYEEFKKTGDFVDQKSKEVWRYYWIVWGTYGIAILSSILYTLYLIVAWIFE